MLELFTSQGCSSCPPADEVLTDFAKQARSEGLAIYPLSFHVDYWNRLGWRDPFSSRAFSERQRRYGRKFSRDGVYTPQLIVNGRDSFPGSRRGRAQDTVKSALKRKAKARIRLTRPAGTELVLSYRVETALREGFVNLALVQQQASNDVPIGENRGRHLSHSNVVRAFETRKLPAALAGRWTPRVPTGLSRQQLEVVVYLQDSNLEVLGAVAIPAAD